MIRLFVLFLIIICSNHCEENQCKKIESNINYLDACLHDKPDSWCDAILVIKKFYCSTGLDIKKIKFNINSFCKNSVQEIFEKLKLDLEDFGFIRIESNCEMFCNDLEYKMGIQPICSALHAAMENKIANIEQHNEIHDNTTVIGKFYNISRIFSPLFFFVQRYFELPNISL